MGSVVGVLAIYSSSIYALVTFFARGGGGGSSSSGGGGDIFALLGYLPMHILGSFIRRFRINHKELSTIAQVVGWVSAVIYGIFWIILLQGLGGIIAIVGLVGIGAGMYGWFGKIRQSKVTKQALRAAFKLDAAWSEDKIISYAKEVFIKYQQDWSTFNTESMKAYMTPSYQYHAALMIYALQLAGRLNIVEDIFIYRAEIIGVNDNKDNAQDVVVVGIEASAKDILLDQRTNTELFTDTSTFTEFWRFKRTGNNWFLDGIQQATAAAWVHNQELENFARQQGYYYCLDWGWLLLPQKGQIFEKSSFGKSDINNHIIGMHGQCLVQLYTFSLSGYNYSNTENYFSKEVEDTYVVAQTNVPKSYGNIVVKKRRLRNIFAAVGELQKISTEWVDFNNKYDVYATNAEQVTSLELLNPKFMEKLEALPFEINLEVVDNVVYLYSKQKKGPASVGNYQIMLSVLNDAFKEMKL